jgi:predicted nucleic acid-binding protein
VALTVRANVVDVRTDTPSAQDTFLVDTNVWYWMHYPAASQQAQQYQTTDYPNYMKSALSAGSSLFCSPLSFSELAHNIESAEREIYALKAGRNIRTKEFRHDYPNQQRRVASLIQGVWSDVLSMSQMMPITLDAAFVAGAVNKFAAVQLDGYDLFMAENALAGGLPSVITDDADYCTFPGLTVFTANGTAIRAAAAAGRLVVR